MILSVTMFAMSFFIVAPFRKVDLFYKVKGNIPGFRNHHGGYGLTKTAEHHPEQA